MYSRLSNLIIDISTPYNIDKKVYELIREGSIVQEGDDMAISDDFSIAVNGDIRYTGGKRSYTALEFFNWLQSGSDKLFEAMEKKVKKKVVYYAHSIDTYDSIQEKTDIANLENLGFEVLNPSEEKYINEYKLLKGCELFPEPMDYWKHLVDKCDAVAFRSLDDGSITAGVVAEVEKAVMQNKPVIELPTGVQLRKMTVAETRSYLESRK